MNFYAVLIGSEILDARRVDAHFEFVQGELMKRDWSLFASLLIRDDETLIKHTFELVKNDPKSVMFSFGGIGATPDDLTRKIAADVFADGVLELHIEGKKIIESRFENPTPNNYEMVNFPAGSELLTNVINQIPGFSLGRRFFFMPGFPNMSHPMVKEALDKNYPKGKKVYKKQFVVFTSEGKIVDLMQKLPSSIMLSSLPNTDLDCRDCEIELASFEAGELDQWFTFFVDELTQRGIKYKMVEDYGV